MYSAAYTNESQRQLFGIEWFALFVLERHRIKSISILPLTLNEVVKNQKFAFYVIPAKAGIYSFRMVMDSGSSPE
jgi:hypothetical protein